VLIAGPALAFVIVALGCGGASPLLGVFCGHNSYIPLAGFTVALWVGAAFFASFFSGRGKPF
jgi:hypothetical protein